MNRNKLLQVSTSDGLFLHGYYVPSLDRKIGVLHIHGFEGNFYENNFIYALANELEARGIGFLTVNTRGNGKIADLNTVDGKIKTIGARFELLEEAHLDITAWLQFLLKEKYLAIVLMGHSLGTMKAVRYLFEGKFADKINKLILLSPFDKKGFMISSGRSDIDGLLEKAQKIVDEGKGEGFVSSEFEDTEISYKTFISWYKQDDLGRVFEFCSPTYNFPVLKKIKVPTKIIVGSKDEWFHLSNPEHPEEAMDILLKSIPNSEGKLIKNAIHSFRPHEEKMATEVSKFILEK